jgi:hypothetical protein
MKRPRQILYSPSSQNLRQLQGKPDKNRCYIARRDFIIFSEAGSYKSGSTTASMLGPLNAGELHTHFDAQTKVEPESNTQIVAGPFGISYFTCFVDSGVILQPKTVGMNVSQETDRIFF